MDGIIAPPNVADVRDRRTRGVDDPTKVQEPGDVGEIEDVDPGMTKEAVFDLTPGTYVLICNQEAHYQAGMHIPFTVTAK